MQYETASTTSTTSVSEKPADPTKAAEANEQPSAKILDLAPSIMSRPLVRLGPHGYAASWPYVQRPDGTEARSLVIVRGDGRIFSNDPIQGAAPLAALPMRLQLPYPAAPDRMWSGKGVRHFVEGARPDPGDVFTRTAAVIDRFIDFDRSLTDQRTMCELVAAYVLMTYLLDAFNVVGYLWPNGERGAGKSTLLFVVSELAYLGVTVLSGGSFASLRDLADYGACIGFDDIEHIRERTFDPDKRALLLSGNRRGATVPIKEQDGNRKWIVRHVNVFSPRLFSAIQLPDEVLGSRTITVPLVRSNDPRRANANLHDRDEWPHDRVRLIDDLWAIGAQHVPTVREYDNRVADRVHLSGRALEPWRALLAVALWLQTDHGAEGVFDRLEKLSMDYQTERADFEPEDPVRVLVPAIESLLGPVADDEFVEFTSSALTKRMNDLAVDLEIVEVGAPFTSPKRVGKLLRRLRFLKSAQRSGNHRVWFTTRQFVGAIARSYGVALQPAENGEIGTLDEKAA